MKLLNLIIPIFIISCTPTEKGSDNNREYKLLGELKDNKGRLLKKAESGSIPGEDIWLKITRYDTLGNIIEEYGARPYGTKYKEVFKYEEKNRLIEKLHYTFKSKYIFSGEFENYGPKEGYELKDTLVDWSVTDKQLEFKVLFSYDDKNELIRERQFNVELDSSANVKIELLKLDTLYSSDNLDSLKENN
jgi:hypothetical protein